MEELKVYEDKMNKTLDVLLSDYGTITAQDVQIPMCWTRLRWTITAPPPPSSRLAMFLFRKPA